MMPSDKEIHAQIVEGVKKIYDPEIPLNIYELGLIYEIRISREEQKVQAVIQMTLTAPACPVAESLVQQVYNVLFMIEGIDEARVDLVFDPPWNQDRISFEGKLELGLL